MRDLGADEALALMRAQNEPLETVVRLVRGDPRPARADRRSRAPTGVERVDDLAVAEGRIWPQSRGSQLAGLAVGSQDGERVLDLCAAPGGKTTQLRGEVTAVELDPHRASELRANVAAARRDERHRGRGRRHAAAARARRLRPGARRRALLRARRARAAARPALARASRCPSSSSRCCAPPAERVRPGGTIVYSVCTMNADENEAVVDASGLRVLPLGDGVARSSPIRAGPSSCSRCRTCTARPASSSPGCRV